MMRIFENADIIIYIYDSHDAFKALRKCILEKQDVTCCCICVGIKLEFLFNLFLYVVLYVSSYRII